MQKLRQDGPLGQSLSLQSNESSKAWLIAVQKKKPHKYQQHKTVNSIDSSAQSTQLDEAFESLQLDEIVVSNISTLSKDERKDSAIKRGENTIVRIRSKVDTGADGNTLPLRMYRKMFPSHLTPDGDPDRANVHHTGTKLTAYNGTPIKHYGAINLPCSFKESPHS